MSSTSGSATSTSRRASAARRTGGGTRRARDERGASAIEFAVIGPVMLLIVFALIQTALYYFARDTAQSAARQGVSYLRLAGNDADPAAFRPAAEENTRLWAEKVGRLKRVVAVGAIDTRTGRVTMAVTAKVALPLGGLTDVTETASATLEQFRADVRQAP